MAAADKLLHEAQYAFHSISYGESSANSRNRRRASKLARKIIRQFPTSPEAAEAHAILRRLGEEAYTSRLSLVHRHGKSDTASQTPVVQSTSAISRPGKLTSVDHETVPLDWSGLGSVLLKLPKAVWGLIGFVAFIFFGIFGYFILLPLLAVVLFTGPFRGLMQPRQREEMNQLIIKANAFIDERLRSA